MNATVEQAEGAGWASTKEGKAKRAASALTPGPRGVSLWQLSLVAQGATQTGLVPEALAALTGEHTQGKLAIEVC